MRNPFKRRSVPLPPHPVLPPLLPIASDKELQQLEERQRRLRQLVAEEEAAIYRSFPPRRPPRE